MAHRSCLDDFIAVLGKTDLRQRQIIADELVTFLSDPDNSIECEDLGLLIDGLVPWLNGVNFKISQSTLDIFTALIGRLGSDFSAYTSAVLPNVIDRLGDSHQSVREQTQILLKKLTECKVLTPQTLLNKLIQYAKHKNAKLREEILNCVVNLLNEHGSQSLSLKTFIPCIIGLIGDPNSTVRDASINTLVEIYKHVGEKLRYDLRKREIPAAKLSILEDRFNEARDLNLLLPSATSSAYDELDTPVLQKPTKPVKRAMSVQVKKVSNISNEPVATGDNAAGAVSADIFESSFESVPLINLFSPRDLDEHMKIIKQVIGDKNMDWEKRVDALRKIRSLLIADAMSYPMFMTHIKDLSIAFSMIIKELRSQVIRETCITIAYMAKIIGSKLDQFCAYIINDLIVTLIPNSAKIISSAGTLALRYIIRYTHSSKLLTPILQNISLNKSKDVRSTLCEVLHELLEQWGYSLLEKNAVAIKDALRKGISDPDADARKHSRKAYWLFKRQFPDLAEQLYNALDNTQQKALDKESCGSAGNSIRGSNGSLHSIGVGIGTSEKIRKERRVMSVSGTKTPAASNVTGNLGSAENLSYMGRLTRAPSLPRSYNRNRSQIPVAQSSRPDSRAVGGFRSVSAVDTAAAQRARARLQYSNMDRMKITSGTTSLPRARKVMVGSSGAPYISQQSPEKKPRTRGPGVSHSQPTSRSTSPSRLQDNYNSYVHKSSTGTVPKKSSGIPRSLVSSRETSPTRYQYKRGLFNTPKDRPPVSYSKPVLAQKLLDQSREAENSFSDALSPDDVDCASTDFARMSIGRRISTGANTGMTKDDHSDDSENSSVCSERSYGSSYHRQMDNYSWSGSQSRLGSLRQESQDISSIILSCASSHWTNRKEGLINLAQYFKADNFLEPSELHQVTDIFTKMFMDAHIKVFSLFLDTVNELIIAHADDLHDWLYILLTKSFIKLGTELLVGSLHNKITKTLDIVHEYFPANLQMQCVFKFTVDNVLTPNIKTKIAAIKFLTVLASNFCEPDKFIIQQPASMSVKKIIGYTTDVKSIELRNQCKSCIIALYNLNSVQMIRLLSELPKQSQDIATNIIQTHVRRNASGADSPHSPFSGGSPKPVQSPVQSAHQYGSFTGRTSRLGSLDGGDNINSEEVYKSLRRTTAEIQNYSFETSGITKLGRDTTSKDSGISQMSNTDTIVAPNGLNGHSLDESSNGSKTQSADTSESGTPEIRPEIQNNNTHSSTDKPLKYDKSHQWLNDNGQFISRSGKTEKEVIDAALQLTNDDPDSVKYEVLESLYYVIRVSNCKLAIENFKGLLRTLIEIMGYPASEKHLMNAQLVVVGIFRRPEMRPCWIQYVELLLLKIISNYKESREIARDIDTNIICQLGKILPVDMVISVVNPIIATGEYTMNLCAVKILMELAKWQGSEFTDEHLETVMKNLSMLTDHRESPMRKAAVFCIVDIYLAIGEERMKRHLCYLNTSKMRLLNVYITKAKTPKKP